MPEIPLGLDFDTAAEEAKVKPLPADSYEAQITDIHYKDKDGNDLVTSERSKNPGTPMQRVEFTIINAEDSKHNNRPLSKFYFSSKEQWALRNYVELYDACGRKWSGEGPNLDELIGETVHLKVEIGEYEGEPTNEIKKIF